MKRFDPEGYTCPRCGKTSYNPHDVANRYCGACHQFEGDIAPGSNVTLTSAQGVPLGRLVKQHYGPNHAILDESGNVMPIDVYDEDGELIVSMLMQWANWYERNPQRAIQRDYIGEHMVSTIFMGLNHQYTPNARPLWFETIVFSPPEEHLLMERPIMVQPSLWSQRTETRAEALAAHQEGLQWLANYLATQPK